MVRIKRIDNQSYRFQSLEETKLSWLNKRHALHHPTDLFVTSGSVHIVGSKPRGERIRIGVVFVHGGVASPSPEWRPGSTAVGGTENLAIRPPRVQSGDHDSSRLLEINSDTTEAEVEVTSRNGGDIGPFPVVRDCKSTWIKFYLQAPDVMLYLATEPRVPSYYRSSLLNDSQRVK